MWFTGQYWTLTKYMYALIECGLHYEKVHRLLRKAQKRIERMYIPRQQQELYLKLTCDHNDM